MKYILQQKLISFGEDFSVLDEQGREVFYFDNKLLALGKKIVIFNASKQEVGVIRRKFFAFRPTYVVVKNGVVLAKISKKFSFFRTAFKIDIPGPRDIAIFGQVLEHNYYFSRDGQTIASVSKQWFKGQDTYSVDVKDDADALFVLSAAVIIDSICHPKRDSGFTR